MASALQIRPYEPADWPALWALLEPVFRAGETFPHDPAITKAEAQMAWVEQSQAVMVAVDATGTLVGTYYLRPNSLALGADVAKAGYVDEHCRRMGIGSRPCCYSLQVARRLGYRAMQFNLVESTSTAGIRCWQLNGFQVVGIPPPAVGRRGHAGDGAGAAGGAVPMKVVPCRPVMSDQCLTLPRQSLRTHSWNCKAGHLSPKDADSGADNA